MRKLIALAAISSLSLMVSACGEKKQEADTSEVAEEAAPAAEDAAADDAAADDAASDDAAAPAADEAADAGDAAEDSGDRTGGIDKKLKQ